MPRSSGLRSTSGEGLFRNPCPPNQLGKWHARFRLLQYRHNLLNTESLPLHGKPPFLEYRFCRKLTLQVVQKSRAWSGPSSLDGPPAPPPPAGRGSWSADTWIGTDLRRLCRRHSFASPMSGKPNSAATMHRRRPDLLVQFFAGQGDSRCEHVRLRYRIRTKNGRAGGSLFRDCKIGRMVRDLVAGASVGL